MHHVKKKKVVLKKTNQCILWTSLKLTHFPTSNLWSYFWEKESEISYATYPCLKLKDPTKCSSGI